VNHVAWVEAGCRNQHRGGLLTWSQERSTSASISRVRLAICTETSSRRARRSEASFCSTLQEKQTRVREPSVRGEKIWLRGAAHKLARDRPQ
jgi:hypothetical protein